MLEWIRQTIFVTSALVGVNLIGVFYVLYIIIPFGIISMLGAGIAAAISNKDCQEKQPNRSLYMLLQFLALALTLVTAGMHLIYFKEKGKEWCHEVFIREDEEEDDWDWTQCLLEDNFLNRFLLHHHICIRRSPAQDAINATSNMILCTQTTCKCLSFLRRDEFFQKKCTGHRSQSEELTGRSSRTLSFCKSTLAWPI